MGKLFGHGFGERNKPALVTREQLSGLKDEEILSKFKSKEWDNINKEGHQNILQELEDRNAARQQREPANITFARVGKGTQGVYDDSENSIYINYKQLKNDQFELLNTYYHESRHAQQYNSPEEQVGHRTKVMCDMENLPRNDESGVPNYVRSDENYALYRTQVSEMDSNNYAAEKMIGHSELFENEEKYNNHIENCQNEFKEVNDAMPYIASARTSMLNDSLVSGQKAGVITDEEAIKQNRINCLYEKDELVQQSLEAEYKMLEYMEKKKNQEKAQNVQNDSQEAQKQGKDSQSNIATTDVKQPAESSQGDSRLIPKMINKNNGDDDDEGQGQGNVSGLERDSIDSNEKNTSEPTQNTKDTNKQEEQNEQSAEFSNQNDNLYSYEQPKEEDDYELNEEEYGLRYNSKEEKSEEDSQSEGDEVTEENFDGEETTEEDSQSEGDEVTEENFDGEETTEEDSQSEGDEVTEENFDGEETTEEDSQSEGDEVTEENFDGEETTEEDSQSEGDEVTEENFDDVGMDAGSAENGESEGESLGGESAGESSGGESVGESSGGESAGESSGGESSGEGQSM